MGVGEEHEVELIGIEREGLEVQSLLLVSPLVHAAVHQEAGVPDLHQVARSGDLARRAADLNEHPSSSMPPTGPGCVSSLARRSVTLHTVSHASHAVRPRLAQR